MGNPIENKFQKMGARVKVTCDRLARVSIDIREDRRGEYFEVRHHPDVEVQVVDVKPADRHLLLMTRRLQPQRGEPINSKFLCGHDERHWFVAAVPESAHARDVQDAKDALKPAEVWQSMREHGVSPRERDKRKTPAFLRQGEWFFLPRPWLRVDEKLVLKDEAIRRGAGKPHVCQFLFRQGGQLVWVSDAYPNGLSDQQYRALPAKTRDKHVWRQMARDARAYVKGSVRHPDHQTIWLPFWYQVVMNTETQSAAMRNVAFLD